MPAATGVRLLDVTLTMESSGRAQASAQWRCDYDADDIGTLQSITLAQAYSTPIPPLGGVYTLQGDTYNGLYLKTLTSRRRPEKRSQFDISGEYSTPDPGQTGGDLTPNPLNRPVRRWLEFETETHQVAEGYLITSGLSGINRTVGSLGPLVNAAGVRFEDAAFEDRQQVYYLQEKHFATLQEIYNLVTAYDHTINSAAFLGFPKHCVKFCGLSSSQPMEENGVVYYVGTLRLGLRGTPWYYDVVNCGTQQIKDGKLSDIREKDVDPSATDNTRISEPANLNLDGTLITDPETTGNIIQYRTRGEANFNNLNW